MRRTVLGLLFTAALIGVYRNTPAFSTHARAVLDLEINKMQVRGDALYLNEQADQYLHVGPVSKAFECYLKAVALEPTEPVFHQNLATAIFLYRKDARAYFGISEQEVFDLSLKYYRRAVALDPANFALATDVALTFYAIRPARPQAAMQAWEHALKIAATELEREGVYLHLARLEMTVDRLNEASRHLALVKHENYSEMKGTLARRLSEKLAEQN